MALQRSRSGLSYPDMSPINQQGAFDSVVALGICKLERTCGVGCGFAPGCCWLRPASSATIRARSACDMPAVAPSTCWVCCAANVACWANRPSCTCAGGERGIERQMLP